MQHKQQRSVYHLHVLRVLLVGILILAFLIVRADMPLTIAADGDSKVLAYATDISSSSLLSETNAARTNANHAPLTHNERLSLSAQAKADDMVKHDYWSHESPDGSQPWAFFEHANYKYDTAGENLAYGFTDSRSAITAWLNSPSHRENLLGKYQEVGFGIASSTHFQGGRYTVIVAHYATPSNETSTVAAGNTSKPRPISIGSVASVNTAQQLFGGTPPILLIVSASLFTGAGIMFILTHRKLMKSAIARGERVIIAHPLVDASILLVTAALILTSTRATIS